MIKPIKLIHLPCSELLEFISEVVNNTHQFNIKKLKLELSLKKLEDVLNSLAATFYLEGRNETTEILANLNTTRDKSITGIMLYCKACSYRNNAEIAKAANLVLNSINWHGNNNSKLNYKAESGRINAIISDWETNKKFIQSIETLNLRNWVNTLKDINTNFISIYENKVDERLSRNIESFSNQKITAIKLFNTLCDTIFAHSIINNKEEYKSLAESINRIIDDYNTILIHRISKKETQKIY